MSTIKTTNITHGSNSGTNNLILADTGKVSIAEKKLYSPGCIIQVVSHTKSDKSKATTTRGSDQDFMTFATQIGDYELAITPTSTSSKILVMFDVTITSSGRYGAFGLVRKIASGSYAQVSKGDTFGTKRPPITKGVHHNDANSYDQAVQPLSVSGTWLDTTHNTTDTITYSGYIGGMNGETVYVNSSEYGYETADDEPYAGSCTSALTAMEICG